MTADNDPELQGNRLESRMTRPISRRYLLASMPALIAAAKAPHRAASQRITHTLTLAEERYLEPIYLRGYEHQRVLNVFVDLSAIQFDSGNAVIYKTVTCVVNQPHRMKKIVNHHRLEHVQLEIPLRAGEPDCRVVAKNLYRDHGHRFALRRVYFAWHD